MIDDSELVIDHGTLGESADTAAKSGMEPETDTDVPSDNAKEEAVTNDDGEFLASGFQDAMNSMMADADQEQVEKVNDVVDELFAGDPVSGDNWDAMQPRSEDQKTDETEQAMESVPGGEIPAEEAEPEMESAPGGEIPAEEAEPVMESAPGGGSQTIEAEVVTDPEPPVQTSRTDDSMQDEDEEPIYDLNELGAVEYVENSGMNQ
jgi:hypothetical protein